MRGRAQVEETTHTYDASGRLCTSRTIREPAWLETDRALAVGLELAERSLCPGCRQPRDRAWHIDQGGWYDVEVVECAGCGALIDEAPKDADARHRMILHDTRPADLPFPDMPRR